jgi:hypothetical protein
MELRFEKREQTWVVFKDDVWVAELLSDGTFVKFGGVFSEWVGLQLILGVVHGMQLIKDMKVNISFMLSKKDE